MTPTYSEYRNALQTWRAFYSQMFYTSEGNIMETDEIDCCDGEVYEGLDTGGDSFFADVTDDTDEYDDPDDEDDDDDDEDDDTSTGGPPPACVMNPSMRKNFEDASTSLYARIQRECHCWDDNLDANPNEYNPDNLTRNRYATRQTVPCIADYFYDVMHSIPEDVDDPDYRACYGTFRRVN